MVGSYQMVTTAGERFEVAIPAFSLDAPGRPTRLQLDERRWPSPHRPWPGRP